MDRMIKTTGIPVFRLIATLIFCLVLLSSNATGVTNQMAATSNIRSIKLYRVGDQTTFPIMALNSTDALELHFDDLEGGIKNYYYSFQLCNADWTPSVLNPFEYTKGFQNVRISNYRNSSIAAIRYTHYQAQVPDRNSYPSRSGNYLLKVFVNNDPSRIAFTKRFVVVDNRANVGAQLLQPFNSQFYRSHQKLQIGITTDNRVQVFSPQDIKVVVLQNNNWLTSLFIDRPTLYRGNYYEYSDEAITAIPAGKEWRWIDVRSLRLQSDRMERIDTHRDTAQIFVKSETSRSGQVYVFYRDMNGSYTIETLETINPFWQGDYGNVHFSYTPPGGKPFEGRDVYVFGELTDYAANQQGRMQFNPDTKRYEATLFLKQGFYNYTYMTLPSGKAGYPDFSVTEGHNWTTENAYTVLVYYRPFGARADELISYASLNSAFQRNGF